MRTAQEILDAHCFGGRVELAESAIKKQSDVHGQRPEKSSGVWTDSR
jgi:hypothetical protein